LEPKMADTILPKTLILSSCLPLVSGLRPASRQPRKKVLPLREATQVREPFAVLWGADGAWNSTSDSSDLIAVSLLFMDY